MNNQRPKMFAPIFSRKKPRQGVLASPLHTDTSSRSYGGEGDTSQPSGSNMSSFHGTQQNMNSTGVNYMNSGGYQQNSWQRNNGPGCGDGPADSCHQSAGYFGRQGQQQTMPNNQNTMRQNNTASNKRPAQNYQFKKTENVKRMVSTSSNQPNQNSTRGSYSGNQNEPSRYPNPPSNSGSNPLSNNGSTRPPKILAIQNQPKKSVSKPVQQWSRQPNQSYGQQKASFGGTQGQTSTSRQGPPPQPSTSSFQNTMHSSHASSNGWGTSSFQQQNNQSNVAKLPQPAPEVAPPPETEPDTKAKSDIGLRIFPISIASMKLQGRSLQHLPVMYEIIGQLDSAVSKDEKTGRRDFQLKDETGSVRTTFIEIDRSLPRLTRGCWHRCLGNFSSSKQEFKCVSIRPAQEQECLARRSTSSVVAKTVKNLTSSVREM